MALIKCSECGKEISDEAEACVHCGCPLITTLERACNLTKCPDCGTERKPDETKCYCGLDYKAYEKYMARKKASEIAKKRTAKARLTEETSPVKVAVSIQKKMKIIVGVAGILIFVYMFAAPYITVYQMKNAAENNDGEALSEYVDFPSLRKSLKDQINARLGKEMAKEAAKDNPFAALGTALAGVLVGKMVDAYVTPAGITELMKGKRQKFQGAREAVGDSKRETPSEPFSDTSMSYESFSKFSITTRGNDSDKEVKFILRRRGMGWKLTEIMLPQPTSAPPSKETIELYNQTVKTTLTSAAMAQYAYVLDAGRGGSFSQSIEPLISEYDLYVPDGVMIFIKQADAEGFIMEAYHEKGTEIYVVTSDSENYQPILKD